MGAACVHRSDDDVTRKWVRETVVGGALVDGSQITVAQAHEAPTTVRQSTAARFVIERPRRGPWLQLFDSAGFEWNRLTVTIDDLPPALHGLRLLHLSDLHLRPKWLRAYDELIQRIDETPPDLVVVTGDFVEHRMNFRRTLPALERLVNRLTSRLGTFAIPALPSSR